MISRKWHASILILLPFLLINENILSKRLCSSFTLPNAPLHQNRLIRRDISNPRFSKIPLYLAKKKRNNAPTGRGFGAPSKTATPPKPKTEPIIAPKSVALPFVKTDQEIMLQNLAQQASQSIVGQAVSSASTPSTDEFWEIIPSLIQSKWPSAPDSELTRIADFLTHAVNPSAYPLEDNIRSDPWRPHEEIHAYMSGLGETHPFRNPSDVPNNLIATLEENYDAIYQEYLALVDSEEAKDRFQSVTSMNYDAGWKTLMLFSNGHKIAGFPYHLCPVTTKIMERFPLAGRIAGFNRQSPNSGIPLHSDGNNMWLTCQMGIEVPKGETAYIRVGPETRHWSQGKCLLYDTTYEHETMNESLDEERVVLHIDFFNNIAMTKIEIEIMTYIYDLREKFLEAENDRYKSV